MSGKSTDPAVTAAFGSSTPRGAIGLGGTIAGCGTVVGVVVVGVDAGVDVGMTGDAVDSGEGVGSGGSCDRSSELTAGWG